MEKKRREKEEEGYILSCINEECGYDRCFSCHTVITIVETDLEEIFPPEVCELILLYLVTPHADSDISRTKGKRWYSHLAPGCKLIKKSKFISKEKLLGATPRFYQEETLQFRAKKIKVARLLRRLVIATVRELGMDDRNYEVVRHETGANWEDGCVFRLNYLPQVFDASLTVPVLLSTIRDHEVALAYHLALEKKMDRQWNDIHFYLIVLDTYSVEEVDFAETSQRFREALETIKAHEQDYSFPSFAGKSVLPRLCIKEDGEVGDHIRFLIFKNRLP